jgi:hypothetical protein
MYVGELARLLNRMSDELDRARDERKPRRAQHLLMAVHAGTDALELLHESEYFLSDVDHALAEDNIVARNRILNDDGLFDAFIEAEQRLLLAVGLAPGVVDPVIGRMKELRTSLVDTRFSAGEIQRMLFELRDALIAISQELLAAADSLESEESHRAIWRKIGAAFEGVLGLAVVGVDGAGALLSLGIAAAPAAVSGAAGGTMAADAAARLQSDD